MKTFKLGGVHPDDNKFAHQSSIEVFLPQQAVLFATQHLGAFYRSGRKGDKVKVGQLIARAMLLFLLTCIRLIRGLLIK